MSGHDVDRSRDAVYRELVSLRRGYALQAPRLRSRVGPYLSLRCDIQRNDTDTVVRQKLVGEVSKLAGTFPPDLRLALSAALAMDSRATQMGLEGRQHWLANRLRCSPRSARRWVDNACGRLAEALLESDDGDRRADPEQRWYVRRLKALLCLDEPAPELYEERTIVATHDDLVEIFARSTLPPPDQSDPAAVHEMPARALYGVRLRATERIGDRHFRHVLTLPRALRRGEELTYLMRYRIPPGQPMRPHYAFVPLIPCEAFHLRVRFDPLHPPRAVWRLDRVAPRLLDDQRPGSASLPLDAAGELVLDFADLVQGYGYGVAWHPAGVSAGPADGRHETGE